MEISILLILVALTFCCFRLIRTNKREIRERQLLILNKIRQKHINSI